jgi:hypothetical protein
MTAKPPPVPSENRSPKGPQDTPDIVDTTRGHGNMNRPNNLEQQGQQGNTKQNTTHQGYQQDR